VVACAKQVGPISWAWPKRFTPLSIKCLIRSAETYELPGRAVTVDPSSYLIINEGTEYSSRIDSTSDVETASVFLSGEICSQVYASLNLPDEKLLDGDEANAASNPVRFVERLYPKDETITPILINIHRLANTPSSDCQLEDNVYLLVEKLFMLHSQTNREIEQLRFAKPSTKEEIYKRLHVCRDFMVSNIGGNLNLEEIASIAGFAPHHFLRVFREVFGATPHQYLTKMRLERAHDMVLKRDQTISEICASVGFESLSSFSALYKRTFKVSPQQERSLERNYLKYR